MSYEMPSVALGDFVLYRPHEDADPNLGIVIGLSKRAVSLWVFVPSFGGVEKFSVHHKDDPGLAEWPEWKSFGVWEHRPDESRLAILSEKVALLEKKLASKPK